MILSGHPCLNGTCPRKNNPRAPVSTERCRGNFPASSDFPQTKFFRMNLQRGHGPTFTAADRKTHSAIPRFVDSGPQRRTPLPPATPATRPGSGCPTSRTRTLPLHPAAGCPARDHQHQRSDERGKGMSGVVFYVVQISHTRMKSFIHAGCSARRARIPTP